MEFFCVAKLN